MAGSLLVLQSGGCTSVMNASLAGVLGAAGNSARVDRVLGAHRGIRGVLRGEVFDLTEQAPALEGVRRTPAALLGSARHRLTDDELGQSLDLLRRLDVRYFHVIGGNDSNDTGQRLAAAAAQGGYELHVVTIPKTVDNDLPETDHTPGYGSAARFIALATMDAGRDTEAIATVDPIKILEAYGRDAGWLAAAAGLARHDELDAPHLIYTPERAFEVDSFLDDVQRCYDRLGFVFVVVSEALRDGRGEYLRAEASDLYRDSFGHQQLGGVAALLCQEITRHLRLKARFDKPGTIQRMLTTCHSATDLAEAEAVGARAVELALAGVSGVMVTLERVADEPYQCQLGHAPLERIANQVRYLPEAYLEADGRAIAPAFRRYAEPLLGEPLPRHPRLARRFVSIPG